MRHAAFCAILLGVMIPAKASTIFTPFPWSHWAADGIAVATVSGQGENTVDFAVREWVRTRAGTPPTITAFRYRHGDWKPIAFYEMGSQYLLLMRKPNDEGAGSNRYWIIYDQFLLDGSDLCVDNIESGPIEKGRHPCAKSVTEDALLDALRSFTNCFAVTERANGWNAPLQQLCTDQELESWAGRSPLHRALAIAAETRRAPTKRR